MGDGEGHVSMRIEEGTWCIILGNRPSLCRTLVSGSQHAILQSALNHPKTNRKKKKEMAEMTAPLLGRFKYVPPTPHPPTHKYTTKSNLSLPLSPLFCHVPTLEAVTPSKQIWTWQPYFGHQDLMGVFNFKSNSSRLIHVVHVKVQIMGFHMTSFHAQQFFIQFNTN